MARIVEDTAGKIRNKPINSRLRRVLLGAAEAAGVDVVRVTSGGQDALGEGDRRTGSTRHDHGNAADLELHVNGRALRFTKRSEKPTFRAFVKAAAARGATGIGAGVGYMGPKRLHVGFGNKLVWGAGGRSANAPTWLRKAARAGWDNPVSLPAPSTPAEFVVIARSGLRLRGGPGTGFQVITTLPFDTVVSVLRFDGPNDDWAQIDLEADNAADGYAFSAFLRPA